MGSSSPNIANRLQALRDSILVHLPEKWRSGRRRSILAGASWSLIGQGGTQLLRLISTLLLAKLLLSPEAFGLVALVNVFISGLEMLSDVGLGPNIVQHSRGEDKAFLRTAYTIQLVRGTALFLLASVLAFPFARFYEEPTLGPLVIVASFSTLFRGTSNIGIHVLTRRIVLRPVTLLTLSSEFVGFAVSVTWALVDPSVWALVIGTVAAAVVYSVGSHIVVSSRHGLGWERTAVSDILEFGGWVFIGTATFFFASQGERLYLGQVATAAELGCFALAASIASLPLRFIQHISSNVIFPVITESLRNDRTEGSIHYARGRKGFLAMAVVSALLFVIGSDPLVKLILDPKYSEVGWMLSLLGIRTALYMIGVLPSNMILALGQSRYSAVQNIVSLVLILAGLLLAYAMTDHPMRWAIVVLTLTPSVSSFVIVCAFSRLAPDLFLTEIKYWIARIVIGVSSVAFIDV